MNIFEMSNESSANVIETMTQSERFNDWNVYGFDDDPNKRYRAALFLQEAASRLYRMENNNPNNEDEEDEKPTVDQTTIVIPTPPEEPATEDPKPDKEPTLAERETLKKAVVMLAEAVKARSSSVAFDNCNRVLDMMRKLER